MKTLPEWFDPDVQRCCLELCDRSYEPGEPADNVDARTVALRLLGDQLLAFIEERGDDAYVVFRGTLTDGTLGNWLFTNFQAYRVPGPGGGSVHKGFWRGYSMLWNGKEPEAAQGSRLRRQYLFGPAVAVLLLVAGWAVSANPKAAVTVFLLLVAVCARSWIAALLAAPAYLFPWLTAAATTGFAVQLAVERGFFEGLFATPLGSRGANLSLGLQGHRLRSKKRVFFVGHSLGGAMATLAFADWTDPRSANPLSGPEEPGDRAHLVTFGSPRVGDDAFISGLERRRARRIVALVNQGDPVPEIPPTSFKQFVRACAGPRPVAHPGRMVIAALLFALLGFYRWCYGQSVDADWRESKYVLGEPGIARLSRHAMTQYRAMLNLWTPRWTE